MIIRTEGKREPTNLYYSIHKQPELKTLIRDGDGVTTTTKYQFHLSTNDVDVEDKLRLIEKAIADILNPKGYLDVNIF